MHWVTVMYQFTESMCARPKSGCCSKVGPTQTVVDILERSSARTCQTLKPTSGMYEVCQYAPARHREGTRFSPETSLRLRMFQTCRASRRKQPPSASSRHMRSRERTYAVLQGTNYLGRFPVCLLRISGPQKRHGICASFVLAMLDVWPVGAAKQVEVEA